MTYKIEFSHTAEKQLGDIAQNEIKKISKRIDKLASNPFPPGYEKLIDQNKLKNQHLSIIDLLRN